MKYVRGRVYRCSGPIITLCRGRISLRGPVLIYLPVLGIEPGSVLKSWPGPGTSPGSGVEVYAGLGIEILVVPDI